MRSSALVVAIAWSAFAVGAGCGSDESEGSGSGGSGRSGTGGFGFAASGGGGSGGALTGGTGGGGTGGAITGGSGGVAGTGGASGSSGSAGDASASGGSGGTGGGDPDGGAGGPSAGGAAGATEDASAGSGGTGTGGTGTGGNGGGGGSGGSGGSGIGGSGGSGTGGSGGSGTGGGGGSGGGGGTGGSGTGGSGGSAGADGGPPMCSGKPGAPGLSMRTVTVGGVARTFLVHIPANLPPNQAAPVVFAHHGFTMSGEIMRTLTSFQALADQEGFVVVFPDGAGTTWNVGTGVCGAGVFVSGTTDDFAFVEAMLADVTSDQCVDDSHVFTTGFSMGGYFSNHIACKRPDLVRAVAPHSGGGPPTGCLQGPKPVMVIHGTADALISYQCGTESRDFWRQHNGCSDQVDVVAVKGGSCEYSRNCPANGQVVLCHFEGMAHGWAGHGDAFYGGGTQFEDATRLVWQFFKSQ